MYNTRLQRFKVGKEHKDWMLLDKSWLVRWNTEYMVSNGNIVHRLKLSNQLCHLLFIKSACGSVWQGPQL